MDTPPPAPGNADFIAIGICRHLDPAWHFATPPPSFPAKPAGIFQAFYGIANCAPTTARVNGKGLVRGEAGAGLLVREPKSKLTPYQLVNCSEFSSGNPVSPQCV